MQGNCIANSLQIVPGNLTVLCDRDGEWNTSRLEGRCVCEEDMENKAGLCIGMDDYFVLLTYVPSFVLISVYALVSLFVCLFGLLVRDIFSPFLFHFYYTIFIIIVIIIITIINIMFFSHTIH